MNGYFASVSPADAIKISVCWFCAGVFLHLILCRLTGTPKYMAKGLASGFLLTFCLIAWQIFRKSVNLAVIYYLFTLWLAYLMFFVNLLNSVTLKMLDYLAHKGGQLNADGFKAIFGGNEGIRSRMEAIKRTGFLKEKDNGMEITAKGRFLVFCVRILRKAIGITEVG